MAAQPRSRGLMRFLPGWLPLVNGRSLGADAIAGLLGALLVLPQGVAFATLAGLPPEYGIYSAVVPCIIAALFGSSWHVMSGPTNANSLALFAMLAPLAIPGSGDYVALALAVTVMVGVAQFVVGAARLGTLANFISPSVLLGFTCGAATLIAVHALKELLGLDLRAGSSPLEVLSFAADVLAHDPGQVVAPATVGLATLATAVLAKRINARLPFMLLGLLAGYGVAQLLARVSPVAVVGPIPSPWPPFAVPDLHWNTLSQLAGISAALTIIALGQSISIAKAVALRSGQQIDPNREFIGQGLSNIVGGFFSCYVSCGSLNRSMPNLEAGARTPLAAVFSSLWLLALVGVSAALLAQIPMAAISAMLILVAWGLFDLKRLRAIASVSRIELAIALFTLVATLVLRLELAIMLGTALSLVAYLYRTSHPQIRALVPDADDPLRRFTPLDELRRAQPECPQVKLVRIEGEVYFGAVQHVADRLDAFRSHAVDPVHGPQKHLLAMTKSMNFIDLAGAEMWANELKERRAMGGDLYFHRPRTQVVHTWEQTGFMRNLGKENIFATKRQALSTIVHKLDPAICATCKVRIFSDCAELPGAISTTSASRVPDPRA